MPLAGKILGALSRASSEESRSQVDTRTAAEVKIDPATIEGQNGEAVQPEFTEENLQRGVRDSEALAMTWSRGTLIAVFIKYVYTTFTRNLGACLISGSY